MSKYAGQRKFLKSNGRKIPVKRSKTAAQVYTLSDDRGLVFSRHLFLWPVREKINKDKHERSK